MPQKKIIGVLTINGEDTIVFEDGSLMALVEVDGALSKYAVLKPVVIAAELRPEDASNPLYSDLPGFHE